MLRASHKPRPVRSPLTGAIRGRQAAWRHRRLARIHARELPTAIACRPSANAKCSTAKPVIHQPSKRADYTHWLCSLTKSAVLREPCRRVWAPGLSRWRGRSAWSWSATACRSSTPPVRQPRCAGFPSLRSVTARLRSAERATRSRPGPTPERGGAQSRALVPRGGADTADGHPDGLPGHVVHWRCRRHIAASLVFASRPAPARLVATGRPRENVTLREAVGGVACPGLARILTAVIAPCEVVLEEDRGYRAHDQTLRSTPLHVSVHPSRVVRVGNVRPELGKIGPALDRALVLASDLDARFYAGIRCPPRERAQAPSTARPPSKRIRSS